MPPKKDGGKRDRRKSKKNRRPETQSTTTVQVHAPPATAQQTLSTPTDPATVGVGAASQPSPLASGPHPEDHHPGHETDQGGHSTTWPDRPATSWGGRGSSEAGRELLPTSGQREITHHRADSLHGSTRRATVVGRSEHQGK
jgi:hypothetical protein